MSLVKLDSKMIRISLWTLVPPVVLLILGIYHGLIQSLYRAGWIKTNDFFGLNYYQGLTLHGVINAIVFTTFFEVAFGNLIIEYYLKKKLNYKYTGLSLLLMLAGTVFAAVPMLGGSASVLYTFYPPLKAHPAFYLGATMIVIGSWVAFFHWIAPYLEWRRENKETKTPLAVVGILTTFTVWFLCTIPLAVEVLFLILPWVLGLTQTIHVTLARTLFWFFGHALVYFWLLPSYIMFYVCLPKVAGGKLYSDYGGRLAFFLFIVLSVPLGVHHQFGDPGIQAGFKWFQGILTFGVALPSFMTAFVVSASLEYAAREQGGKGLFSWWCKLPYFSKDRYLFSYFFCGLVLFLFGGITGIINASMSMNGVVHNTAWIPGHFHTTVGGPVFLSFIGMSLFLVAQLRGRHIRFSRLNWSVPYLWLVGVMIASTGQSVAGLMGQPRRTNLGPTFSNPDSPFYVAQWKFWSVLAAVGGIVMFIACLFYFISFFATLIGSRDTEPGLEIPTAEAYHDEEPRGVKNFLPWVVAAVILIVISYLPPLMQIITSPNEDSMTFTPSNPIPGSP